MSTDALLRFGAASAVIFAVVVTVEGATRPGYRATYHMGSELELGSRGWVQRVNFALLSAGLAAVATGVQRTIDAPIGAGLLWLAALAVLVAAVFAPDPVRGYPPEASTQTAHSVTNHARLHDFTGPLVAVALLGACLAVAPQLAGWWATYTWVTAGVGLVFTVGATAAYLRDTPFVGLVQRVLMGAYLLWITLLSLHLTTR